jgi:hypothetical protein
MLKQMFTAIHSIQTSLLHGLKLIKVQVQAQHHYGLRQLIPLPVLTSGIFGSGVGNIPVGQAGGENSFALVNYTSTTSTGTNATISNWLLSPAVNVKDGDVVSFYTRKGTDGTTDYPDRLE